MGTGLHFSFLVRWLVPTSLEVSGAPSWSGLAWQVWPARPSGSSGPGISGNRCESGAVPATV